MRIFSKLNSNEYNNQLEKILENKTFDESVKNLLLSMLYKIENGYADYSIVKFNALPKADFMEKILNIIDKQCFEIKLVIPETEESKPLEHDNVVCRIDADRGSILVYANEEAILYSLIQMNLLQEKYNKNQLEITESKYYRDAINKFLLKAKSINGSEVIRDFDGWSWNNNIKKQSDFEYNLIFQNMMLLNLRLDDNFKEKIYEQNFQNPNLFYQKLYTIILAIIAKQDEKIKNEITTRLNELIRLLFLMEDRVNLLNKITEEKKMISSKIKEIDETLNDKEKLKKEYINRNSKLPNKDKIFSVSFLYDILENERKAQVEKLKTMNGYLDPRNFSKQKTNMENECSLLKNVIELAENGDLRKQEIIEFQKEVLKYYQQKIEENLEDKDFLEKVLYEFRYYCMIPITKNEVIGKEPELQESIEKVMNIIIDNCIDKEIITNFSNSASICYAILKYIFITKIIDLKEIQIKINKIKEIQYVNEVQSQIAVSIYDEKEAESIYNETVYNLKSLNVKLNKKIPLFLK